MIIHPHPMGTRWFHKGTYIGVRKNYIKIQNRHGSRRSILAHLLCLFRDNFRDNFFINMANKPHKYVMKKSCHEE